MSEETNTEEQGKKLTSEELAERRKNLITFYKSQVELLKHQESYEKLVADIEEHKLRGLVAMVRQGQIMSPPDKTDNPDTHAENEEKKERTLKKS
jgi:hypothetical protein